MSAAAHRDPITGAPAQPWRGGRVSDRATCLLAPNPGPMTLDGTNTWVLCEPGATRALVVDPGPDDATHLRAVLDHATAVGVRISGVLLTHGHPDHAEGARRFAGMAGCGVRALDPAHRLGSEGLGAGDVVALDGLEVRVVATPGHTADSLTFHLPAEGAVLTGDTVLGRGTTVVAHPEGRLGDYLHSLQRLADLAAAGVTRVLPGHGPVLDDAAGVLEAYRVHRAERLAQVAAALAGGATTAEAVVDVVYEGIPEGVRPAALLSVAAQLAYLTAPDG